MVEILVNAENVEKREVFYKWDLIKYDKDDNKFADCAIAGSVDYLVSDDKHFNVLKKIKFPPLKVLKTNEFMKILMLMQKKYYP